MKLIFLYICQKQLTVELAVYIKKLLYNRDILIIPGLGGLVTKYKPAEIDISKNIITPPTKFLTFDQQLSMRDRTLVDFVAIQKKMSLQEADAIVTEEITTMLHKLELGETVLVEGIGYFSKDGDMIRFEHEPNINFLTESFGLSNVDYKSVEFKLTPQPIPENNPVIQTKRKRYRYVLAGIFLIVAGGVIVYLFRPEIVHVIRKNLYHKQAVTPIVPIHKRDTASTVAVPVKPEATDNAKIDTVEKIIDVNTEKKNALAIKKIDKKPSFATTQETYYIIAGSFKTSKSSDALVNILKKEGLNAEVIEFAPDLFRVSLGNFQNRTEAVAELSKIKSKKGLESAWLLAKK